MADTHAQAADRFIILCRRCDRPVIARREWIGRDVQCPHCYSVISVPPMPADGRPVPADAPNLSPKYCFNFACPRCDCVLEAHTGMCGKMGTCPTCAARFYVPYLRGKSGMPERATLLDEQAETPVPTHAYGASGHQAPRIISRDDGTAVIECPRCNAYNPIDADVCTACGTPFTMEAAPTIGGLYQSRRANASVTLGVVALVLFPAVIPGLLATWLALRSLMFAGPVRRSGLAYAGLTLGLVSLMGAAAFWYVKLIL